MSWAGRRKALIITGIALVVLAFLAIVVIAVVYEAPTCTDQKQNQDEEGIDCGGSCQYLCTASVREPVVRFVRALSPSAGRYDIIAYIDNPNQDSAAKGVRYTVDLYDVNHLKMASRAGVIDIPANTTVPLYIPELYRGNGVATQAFLTLDPESYHWYHPQSKRIAPTVMQVAIPENSASPRITATLVNPTAYPLYSVTPVIVLFDAENNAIAASQTFIPQISPQGSTQALYTWSAPFSSAPVKAEVLSILPLPYP